MSQKSILIVDDDKTTRDSLASLLQSEAVTLRTGSTIEEAETLLKSEPFDLVITDLQLSGRGGMDGLELISRINARMPKTLVVLFTAYGSAEIEQEAKKRGASDYWEKTIEIATLVERVRALGILAGPERKDESNGFTTSNAISLPPQSHLNQSFLVPIPKFGTRGRIGFSLSRTPEAIGWTD